MRSAVPRPHGRTGQLLTTAMLVALPLAATTACAGGELERGDQQEEQEQGEQEEEED